MSLMSIGRRRLEIIDEIVKIETENSPVKVEDVPTYDLLVLRNERYHARMKRVTYTR